MTYNRRNKPLGEGMESRRAKHAQSSTKKNGRIGIVVKKRWRKYFRRRTRRVHLSVCKWLRLPNLLLQISGSVRKWREEMRSVYGCYIAEFSPDCRELKTIGEIGIGFGRSSTNDLDDVGPIGELKK